MKVEVKVDTLVPAGVVHDFVPSGQYNTRNVVGLAGTKPENQVCWQLVVSESDRSVEVCYAGPYEPIHGDGVVRVITDVLTSAAMQAPSFQMAPESKAQMIANRLRDRGLVK